MAKLRHCHAPLAWVGIALFMALPSILILGFGHWTRLRCAPYAANALQCQVERAAAWGLIPTTQQTIAPTLSASVVVTTCAADYCVYILTLNGATETAAVFKFYSHPQALAAAEDLNQSLEAEPTQSFQTSYHEPVYLLAVAVGLLLLAGCLATAGLRRSSQI